MTDQFDGDVPHDDDAESGGDFETWLDSDTPELRDDPPTNPLPLNVLEEVVAGGNLPDWLSSDRPSGDAEEDQPDAPEGEADFEAVEEETPVPQAVDDAPAESGGDLPDWLNAPTQDDEATVLESVAELADDSAADEDVPDWVAADAEPTQAAEESEAQTYEDWAQENLPEEDLDAPDWVSGDTSDFAEASAADSGLTYEEWERQQDEAEYEETREPDIPLPDFELPDLTADIAPGKPPTGDLSETQNYMPDWFMGVEELKDEDAPDWLKGADLETGQFGTKDAPADESLPSPTSPVQAADDMLPDFDALMGDSAPPDFEELPEASSVDAAPQIRRLGDIDDTPAGDSDALSIDDILFGDDAPAPPELPEADLASPSPQDEFGELFGDDAPALPELPEADLAPQSPQDEFAALFGDDAPAPPDLPEGEAVPVADDVDFDNDHQPDWLQNYDADTEHAALDAEKSEAPDYAQDEPATQETLESGMLPDWFGDVDFSAAQAEAEQHLDDDALAEEPAEEALDLDVLFSSESAAAAQTLTPSGRLVETEEVDDLASDEDLGFDDDMFAQFAAPAPADDAPTEEAFDDAEELERAEIASSDVVPDWVQHMGMSGDEVVLNTGGVEEHFEQVPPVVLPNELRALREEMAEHIDQPAARRAQIDQGPLAGVDDALDIESALSEPGQLSLSRTAYDMSDSQQMRLNALQSVLQAVDEETEAERIEIRYDLGGEEYEVEGAPAGAPEPRPETRRAKRRPDRLLVMLALLIVAVVPFATEELHLAENPPTVLDENAMPLAIAIDALGETDAEASKRVLVAVEYGPSTARELDPLLEAVLRDIMAHGGTPVVISTNPLGLLHASHLLESLATDMAMLAQAPEPPRLPEEASEEASQFIWNRAVRQCVPPPPEAMSTEYEVLRYLPAGAVGVRSMTTSETSTGTIFTRDFYGDDTNLEIAELDAEDFAFIVVAGERYEDARIWAEQTSALEVDKFALVTAAAEPITQPYVSAGEYDGIMSGIRGALMYDACRNGGRMLSYDPPENLDVPNPTLSRWHSAALGAIAAAVVIGLGSLFNIARMFRRRREQHS